MNLKYNFIWIYHWLFDWLLPKNVKYAVVGDRVLINFRCKYRFPGTFATVIETDREYWEDSKTRKVVSEYKKNFATIRFASGKKIYNLVPKEYWIITTNKNLKK